MAHPAAFTPLLLTNPLGWAIVGTAGYLTYRSGKKSGLQAEEQVEQPGLCDRAIKGTIKTAYKAKSKVENSLSATKDKYSGMWAEAKEDVNSDS